MPDRLLNQERYTGQKGLAARLGLGWPPPPVVSIVGAGTRRSVRDREREVERYVASYDYGDTVVGDLKFALRYEALDLGLMRRAFLSLRSTADLRAWIASEPTGAFARRAWFLYERLTDKRLRLPDATSGAYVPALDPDRHLVWTPATPARSRRHRVADNLLGGPGMCPTVRVTPRLAELRAAPVSEEARRLVDGCDPAVLRRAIDYLFTKETRSSFEIEGERPDEDRTRRFVKALEESGEFDPASEADYVALQNLIISDPRYRARGWRRAQNFIGSVGPAYTNRIHCVFPKPEDVPALMRGVGELAARLATGLDPIAAAALVSFAFVFVHPFDDGNGRIHRFLIHRVLAAAGVAPPGLLFPVSATMLRDMRAYDAALESFSGRVMPYVEWRWVGGEGGGVEVRNDTADLYRFFDATAVVEYLYERVIETVRTDLKEELDFLAVYDRAYRGLTARFDGLPASRISLLARLCLQNGGRLAAGKRRLFRLMTDAEIAAAEALVGRAMTVRPPSPPAAPAPGSPPGSTRSAPPRSPRSSRRP